MPPRVRLLVIAVFACALAALAGVWIAALTGGDGAGASAGPSGSLRPPGARVPDYLLRDQDGRPATPADHAGSTTVYAFVYSTCEDVCPLEVQQIRGALDDLGRDVPVVGISVDPAGDTRQRARSFLIKQHMTGRMRFLLGTRTQLAPVWKAFGIQPQQSGADHSAYVVVVDGRGRQRFGYPVARLTSDGLARDLAGLG